MIPNRHFWCDTAGRDGSLSYEPWLESAKLSQWVSGCRLQELGVYFQGCGVHLLVIVRGSLAQPGVVGEPTTALKSKVTLKNIIKAVSFQSLLTMGQP